jgi:hypothetical protein
MLNAGEVLETCERLKIYPNLVEKIKEMLDLIEKEEIKSVDDFEEALIPQVRKLGGEITQTWASNEEKLLRKKMGTKGEKPHSKKNSNGKQPLGK